MGAADRNSGHFVQGHVDGTGEIADFTRDHDSLWVRIRTPREILANIVKKGYVAIDGTSLTVCEVNTREGWFNVMLIAHTQNHIVLPLKKVGDKVNLEADVLGKYAARSLAAVVDRVDALEQRLQKAERLAVVGAGISAVLSLALVVAALRRS